MKKTQIFISNKIERLDIFLASEIGQSRSQISQLIKQNCVYIDEKLVARPGVKLKVEQNIKVEFPKAKKEDALRVDFDVEILYEDDDVLVINKPS
jgi:23S rRNA pseudouridine1911/1915/1917 synthase